MKQKKRIALACISSFVASLALIFVGTTTILTASTTKEPILPSSQKNNPITNLEGTVNERENSGLIPDRVGFMLLFRFISEVNGDVEKKAMREFVRRQIGLGEQPAVNCPAPSGSSVTSNVSIGTEEEDIDTLITAAESFKRQVAQLDSQAKGIKDQFWPNPSPEVMGNLTLLQKQKEALADRTIATILTKLSPAGLNRVVSHVNHRVKPLTKRFPGPRTLPGGEGWKPHSPTQHQ